MTASACKVVCLYCLLCGRASVCSVSAILSLKLNSICLHFSDLLLSQLLLSHLNSRLASCICPSRTFIPCIFLSCTFTSRYITFAHPIALMIIFSSYLPSASLTSLHLHVYSLHLPFSLSLSLSSIYPSTNHMPVILVYLYLAPLRYSSESSPLNFLLLHLLLHYLLTSSHLHIVTAAHLHILHLHIFTSCICTPSLLTLFLFTCYVFNLLFFHLLALHLLIFFSYLFSSFILSSYVVSIELSLASDWLCSSSLSGHPSSSFTNIFYQYLAANLQFQTLRILRDPLRFWCLVPSLNFCNENYQHIDNWGHFYNYGWKQHLRNNIYGFKYNTSGHLTKQEMNETWIQKTYPGGSPFSRILTIHQNRESRLCQVYHKKRDDPWPTILYEHPEKKGNSKYSKIPCDLGPYGP